MSDEPKDLLDVVQKGITAMFGDRSPEARLLAKRDRRIGAFRGHSRAYMVVIGGLILLNMLIAVTTGVTFPWAAFPAIGWGMGFAIHGLSHRSWMKRHEQEVLQAEIKLGKRLRSGAPKMITAPKKAPVIDGVTIVDGEWQTLLEKLEAGVERTLAALDGVDQQASSTVELQVHLEEGLENARQLAVGAVRIQEAMEEIAPEGGASLGTEVEAIDAKINAADDAQLKEVYHANRSMLIARRAKLDSLTKERARMKASAEGFLLATENVRLDIARLGADEAPRAAALIEPAKRLNQEVEVLRKVEAELRQLT